jgi:hypothetical protein
MKLGKFVPNVKWGFDCSTMGVVYSSNNEQIGFYEEFRSEKFRFVIIYTNEELMEKYLDEKETERFGGPIPIKEVRDFVKSYFNIIGDDNVFWWTFDDYVCNIDGGSVPSLCGNEEGWKDWIETITKFGNFNFETSVEKQINFSKGIY